MTSKAEVAERQSYSVLMSVYGKEKAEQLREAMDSIWAQTVKTDDLVLVCDGPLGAELEAVIDEMAREHPELRVHRLPENVGLGRALNAGLPLCKNELVARMDSDDISRPERCARQLAAFREDPALGIVSGTVEEFSLSPSQVEARRVLPEEQEEILRFAKSRNPFNHPCVMFKKSLVEQAGGYQDIFLLEDYHLWLRMLLNGAKGRNLPEALLWMRAGSGMYRRRGGWAYAKSQRKLFLFMREQGFISPGQYRKSVALRSLSALAPSALREFLFKAIMRKKSI